MPGSRDILQIILDTIPEVEEESVVGRVGRSKFAKFVSITNRAKCTFCTNERASKTRLGKDKTWQMKE